MSEFNKEYTYEKQYKFYESVIKRTISEYININMELGSAIGRTLFEFEDSIEEDRFNYIAVYMDICYIISQKRLTSKFSQEDCFFICLNLSDKLSEKLPNGNLGDVIHYIFKKTKSEYCRNSAEKKVTVIFRYLNEGRDLYMPEMKQA